MAMIWGDSGNAGSLDRPEFGRPRPEPPQMMTARQLVYACTEARSDDDMEYAVGEVDAFLDANGDDLDSAVLIALLDLPDDELTRPLIADVSARLADRTPAVVEAILRTATSGAGPSYDNAAAVLDMLPDTELALGLVEVLCDDTEDELKEAAANVLVVLGKPVAGIILDALADETARGWIVYASGCARDDTDAQVMRTIAESSPDGVAGDVARQEPASSVVDQVSGASAAPRDARPTGDEGDDSPDAALDDAPDAPDDAPAEAAPDVPDDAADDAPDGSADAPDDAPADTSSSDLEAELKRDIAAFEEHLNETPGGDQG
jgi:hypothetical protein